MHDLAAGLPHPTEWSQVTAGRRFAKLLRELAPRHVLASLARFDLALRDRPRAIVAALPERAAWVNEQDLQLALDRPIEQQPGGFFAQGYLRVSWWSIGSKRDRVMIRFLGTKEEC